MVMLQRNEGKIKVISKKDSITALLLSLQFEQLFTKLITAALM